MTNRKAPTQEDLRDCLSAVEVISDAMLFIQDKAQIVPDCRPMSSYGIFDAEGVLYSRERFVGYLADRLHTDLGRLIGAAEPDLFARLLKAKCRK